MKHIKKYSLAFIPFFLGASLPASTLEQLTKPLVFTKEGVELFFLDQFNNPLYTAHVLPSHFGHLAHFLHYSSTLSDPYGFVLTILDIYHMRLKDAQWVNALSLSLLLEQLPRYLGPLIAHKEQEELQQTIKDILYKRFLGKFTTFSHNQLDGVNNFDIFLQAMDEVINPTAGELAHLVTTVAQRKSVAELQHLVSRFIESALEKIVWNPHTQEDSWNSLSLLAAQIEELYHCGILTSSKTVNHLYWTLLYRYGYFLRSTKDIMSPTVFGYIKEQIARDSNLWLLTPEPEEFLTTKKDYLTYTVWECLTDQELGRKR